MSTLTGGKATSAVPVGMVGTSAVPGVVCDGPGGPSVVATLAGDWMTPTIGIVSVPGRGSSDLENPYATSAAATMTAMVTAMSVVRDRRFGSIGSTTLTTLST